MPINDWPLSSIFFREDGDPDITLKARGLIGLFTSKMSLSFDQADDSGIQDCGYYKFAFNRNLGMQLTVVKSGTTYTFYSYFAYKNASGKWTTPNGTNWYSMLMVNLGDGTPKSDSTKSMGVGLRIKQFGNVTVYLPVVFSDTSESRQKAWWTFTATDQFTNKTTKGLYNGFYAVMIDDETKVLYNSGLQSYGGTSFPNTLYIVASPCIVRNNFFYGHIGSSTCIYWLNVSGTIGKVIKVGAQTFECLDGNIYIRRS